jgi:hypothetical protein
MPLAAIVLYDNEESGRTAERFLNHVIADAGGGIQSSLALWRIDSLPHPDTSPGFFRDLERSTILALALGGGGELPKSVFDWVERWAHRQFGDASALGVFGDPGPAAVEELAKTARRFGIEFFWDQRTQPGLKGQNFDDQRKRQNTLFPIREEFPDNSRSGNYRHLGINE